MFKNMKKSRIAGVAMSAAIIGSSMSMISMPAQAATGTPAYGGVEDPNNGIIWGVGSDGSYMIPTAQGEIAGWCIDSGNAYPKQGGITQYSDPVKWGGQLSADDQKRLAVALFIGQGISKGQVPPAALQFAGLIGLPNNLSLDQIAAGVSGVVHMLGMVDGKASVPFTPDRITDPNARAVYDKIMQMGPMLPVMPDQLGMIFSIRTPTDGSNKQRMIAMSDININFEIPSISFPPPTDGTNSPPTSPPQTSNTTTTTSRTPNTDTTTTTPNSSTPPTAPVPSSSTPAPNVSIRTSAGSKAGNVVEQGSTITDTVTYSGLTPGQAYVIKGETVVKDTGAKDGNSGETTFTPTTPNGRIDVKIPINSVKGQELVVFESLHKKGDDTVVAKHEDKNDSSQTVGRAPTTPQIRTSAESSTGNFIQSGTTVNDTVTYTGLTPGKKYRLEARLMCKADGSDTGATQTHEFTPSSAEGTEVVPNIAVTNPDCNEQVAFEKLYDDTNKLVASHEDITDASQTVGGQEALKKKKKDVPVSSPSDVPVVPVPVAPAPTPGGPVAMANSDANAGAPGAPAQYPVGVGGGPSGGGVAPVGVAPVGGGGVAPRQVIVAVPSGDSDIHGVDLFTR